MSVGQWGEMAIQLPAHLRESDAFYNGQRLRGIAQAESEHVRLGQIPAAFFARDEQGGAIPGPPPIRWVGNNRRLLLQSFGEQPTNLLAQYGHNVGRALTRHFERPLAQQFREGRAFANASEPFVPYRVPWFVFPNSRRFERLDLVNRSRRGEAGLDEVFRAEIARLIENGLVELANDRYEMDMPEFEIEGIGWDVDRMVPTKRLASGRRLYHLAVKNLRFHATVKLYGPWAVGAFRSYGFGGILPPRQIERQCDAA